MTQHMRLSHKGFGTRRALEPLVAWMGLLVHGLECHEGRYKIGDRENNLGGAAVGKVAEASGLC